MKTTKTTKTDPFFFIRDWIDRLITDFNWHFAGFKEEMHQIGIEKNMTDKDIVESAKDLLNETYYWDKEYTEAVDFNELVEEMKRMRDELQYT